MIIASWTFPISRQFISYEHICMCQSYFSKLFFKNKRKKEKNNPKRANVAEQMGVGQEGQSPERPISLIRGLV